MTSRALFVIVLAIGSCDACDEESRLRKEETHTARSLASASQTDESIQPVYPRDPKEIPPLAVRLCEALHGAPRKKRAECCASKPGADLTAECERNLAGALLGGGVELDESSVAKCERAIAEVHASCEWIGPWLPPTPTACLGIVAGARAEGEPCRSSLECEVGQRCFGVGPTDPGRCAPAPPVGSVCGLAVDPLAVYVREDDLDRKHPQCRDGFCDRTRCVHRAPEGSACRSSLQCNGKCIGGRCVSGDAGEGDACSGGECTAGLRCIAGICAEPKSLGDACSDDRECKSACTSGKCQMRCVNSAISRGLIKTKQ